MSRLGLDKNIFGNSGKYNQGNFMGLRLLVDMDDVLVDFTNAACKVHGFTRAELEARRKPGNWGMAAALGMSENEFWKPINELGESFWENLEPTQYMKSLAWLVYQYDTDWIIVSAPPPKPGNVGAAYNGKIKWLEKHLGSSSKLEFVGRKHLLAGLPGTVLIDDKEENIEAVQNHGGVGIIYPHESNSLFIYAGDPLQYVDHMLRLLVD